MGKYSRECLVSRFGRRFIPHEVMDILTELFIKKRIPVHIQSDNGSKFSPRNMCKNSFQSRKSSHYSLSLAVSGKMVV